MYIGAILYKLERKSRKYNITFIFYWISGENK